MTTRQMGDFGEDFAQKRLEEAGCQLLKRNYTIRGGEIDMILRQGEYILFVEVRTRGADSFGRPLETVDTGKMRRIIKAAQRYLYEQPSQLQPRFDLVEVVTGPRGEVVDWQWLKGAFCGDDI